MTQLTAAEKIKVALDWVARLEPIAIPVVLSRWSVKPSTSLPTMATNGRVLQYNPSFVDKLSLPAAKAIVLHEVGHVLSNHQHRRGKRNPKGYNIAADLALNCMLYKGYREAFQNDTAKLQAELIDSKVSGGCFVGFKSFEGLPHNKSAEEYYDLLKQLNPPPPPQPPQPPQPPTNEVPVDGDPCGEGDETDGEGTQVTKTRSGKDKGKPSDEEDSIEDPDYVPGSDDGDSDDDSDDSGSGKSGDKDSDEDSDSDSDGGGKSYDGSDFEDSDESSDESSDSGNGSEPSESGSDPSTEHDPFANLPDPTETFGGGVEDAPEEVTLREDEAKLILEALLGSQTYSPTGLGDIISQYKERIEGDPELAASINWRKELEKFLRVQHAAGWKYDRPSRRHSHRKDLLLPARRARSKTRGLFIVDTSASMSDDDCNQAITHLGKVLSLFPQSTVTLLHCDTAVRASRDYRSSDFPITEFQGWAGRGSTELAPAFNWAKQRKSEYDWIVVVSDMQWSWWRAADPGLPTLWINTCSGLPYGWHVHSRLPFGKLVNFHAVQMEAALN